MARNKNAFKGQNRSLQKGCGFLVAADGQIIHKDEIEQAFYEAMQELEVSNMKEEKQGVWKACLQLVGVRLFPDRSSLKDKVLYPSSSCTSVSNNNRYDYELLDRMADIYIHYSTKYNKLISIMAFSYMINMDYSVIEQWKYRELGSPTYNIYQKLIIAREESLKDKCADSNNVVGAITIGNNEFGWSSPYVRQEPKHEKVVSLSDIKNLQIEQKTD